MGVYLTKHFMEITGIQWTMGCELGILATNMVMIMIRNG